MEEENIYFPEQSIDTSPDLNHKDRGVKVSRQGKDNWGQPFWYDKWHPQNEEPITVSDACPFSYVDVTDETAKEDCHMSDANDLVAKTTFMRDDFDITLFSDRGLGRAKLVIYRRQQALLDMWTADSLRILRVVMGDRLVGFLIWNCYEAGRLIPYWVMTATQRGNGCLQKDPQNDGWCSRWYINDKDVPRYLLKMRDKSPMIDLVELLYWGYFGVKYKSLETLKRGGDGYRKVQVQSTDEDLVIDIEYVYIMYMQ